MNELKLTADTINNEAQFCFVLIAIIYLLNLRNKSKNAYLNLVNSLLYLIQLIALALITLGISPTHYAVFGEWALQITQGLQYYFFLFFAYSIHDNLFPKERNWVISLYGIIFILSLYSWFHVYQPGEPQTAFNLLLFFSRYFFLTGFSIVVYIRKIKRTKAILQLQRLTALEKTNYTKAIYAYKNYIIAVFITVLGFFVFLLYIIGVISSVLSVFIIAITAYIVIIIFYFNILNYSYERSSFQFKLVLTVLCVVLIVLGLLPLSLYGTALPSSPGYPVKNLNFFLILIPCITIFISFIMPVLFRYSILKPLINIMEGVKRLNNGNLSGEIPVNVNDEIGTLTQNFNRMTASLRRYSDKMNELVNERTNELNQSLQELKSTQSQLIQSEKMASLGELTAGIAHEIQNPLNFVNNFSEVNQEMIDEATEEINKGNYDEVKFILNDIKENSEKINHHGKRADSIVKGMLQHSRQTKGVKEPTDINALCDEYLRLSYHGLRAKDKNFNADFKTDFDETIGKINIVPQDIGRVLLNLFNNAFYAVDEKQKAESLKQNTDYKPVVLISIRHINPPSGDGGIKIIVSDNGNGIPQNIIEKIFQPFFTTKPTGQGTGLGLSLAYDIITKEHNGTIKAESKEGERSLFTIQLPG